MKKYMVIEDNGGGLTLVVFAADGETIEYIHSGYEYNPGQLSADLRLLKEGSDPARYWDGNDLDSVDGMENPTDLESWFPWSQKGQGWEVVADNDGIYPDDMGGAASREFLHDAKGRVKFQTLQAMGYEDGKALLELLDYEGGETGTTESNISDWAQDEYFRLFDTDGEEIDIVSWETFGNGQDGDEMGADIVREGWSESLRKGILNHV